MLTEGKDFINPILYSLLHLCLPISFPQLVHHPQHLQREHVLAEIVTILENDVHIVGVHVGVLKHHPQRTHLAVHYLAPVWCYAAAPVAGIQWILDVLKDPRVALVPQKVLQHGLNLLLAALLGYQRSLFQLFQNIQLFAEWRHVMLAALEVDLQQEAKPRLHRRCLHFGAQVPEEVVSDALVAQSSL